MNRRNTVHVALLLMVLSVPPVLGEGDCSKLSLKGLTVGMPLSEVQAMYPGGTPDPEETDPPGDAFRWESGRVKTSSLTRVRVDSDGRLVLFQFRLAEEGLTWEDLLEALGKKWGQVPGYMIRWEDSDCDVVATAMPTSGQLIVIVQNATWEKRVSEHYKQAEIEKEKAKERRAREALDAVTSKRRIT